jgi:hypothetical protein
VIDDHRLVCDPARRFTLVINDFILGGGDGNVAFKGAAEGPGARVGKLPDRAQQVFINYLNRVLGRKVDLPDPVLPPRVARIAP